MAKPKKTPWFDGSVKPARDGVYEVRVAGFGNSTWFKQFACKRWGYMRRSPEEAVGADVTAGVTPERWRGLAEEPK